MLLDLPHHDLIPIITSDEEFRNHVDQAVEIINAAESRSNVAGSASGASMPTIDVIAPPVEQTSSQVPVDPFKLSASSSTSTETELPDEETIRHCSINQALAVSNRLELVDAPKPD